MDSPSDERYHNFSKLFTKHEGPLRVFVLSLLRSLDDVDEVMQEVGVVAWTKFDHFDPNTNFMAWIVTIARFEVMGFRKKKARDRLVFSDEVINLLAQDTEEQSSLRAEQRQALSTCLQKLPDAQRQLILHASMPGRTMKQIAEDAGLSANAVYKRVDRIKAVLFHCVRATVEAAT